MVIRRSAANSTAQLIGDLVGRDPVMSEAALARLAIAGPRTVSLMLRALPDADADAQAVLLRALGQIGAPPGLPAILQRLDTEDQVIAFAAVSAAQCFLTSADADAAARALDALTRITLDTSRPEALRAAAVEALSTLDAGTVDPIRDRLRQDPSSRVRRAAGLERGADPSAEVAAARLEASSRDPSWPPRELRGLIADAAPAMSLATLHELVLILRDRERNAEASARPEWQQTRAEVHRVLAARGSRVGLFDLRETLGELPPERLAGFLPIAGAIGDTSCLEPLGAAWQASSDAALSQAVLAAFSAIVSREGLTRRHAVLRNLRRTHPELLAAIDAASSIKEKRAGGS